MFNEDGLDGFLSYATFDKSVRASSIYWEIERAEETLSKLKDLAKEREKEDKKRDQELRLDTRNKQKEKEIQERAFLKEMTNKHSIVVSFIQKEDENQYSGFSTIDELFDNMKKYINVKGFSKLVVFGNDTLMVRYYSGNTNKVATIIKMSKKDIQLIQDKYKEEVQSK